MSYTKKTLAEFEQIEEVAHIHWIKFIKADFIVLCLLILTMGLRAVVMDMITVVVITYLVFKVYMDLWTTEMIITNMRVVSKEGLFNIVTQELKNKRIESVEIRQSFWGSILGYADIHFSGTGTSDVWFKCVSHPYQIKKRAESVIDL